MLLDLPNKIANFRTRKDIQFFSDLSAGPASGEIVGLFDYTYMPIALGDTFTSLIKMSILAHRNKASTLRLYVNFDGGGFQFLQRFVDESNYRVHLSNILPAFRFSPMPTSLHICNRPSDMNSIFFSSVLKRQTTWPSLRQHLNRLPDYYSHSDINAFYRQFGFIPQLSTPSDQVKRTDHLVAKHFAGKFLVTVHIRQRAFMDNMSCLYRDSSIETWYRFFDIIAKKYPSVVFLNVGSFVEWERCLARKPNVVISRLKGMDVADEVSLLLRSNLFMGTSSGFSAAATFSSVPYVITHYDPNAASAVELSIGQNYPFATEHQTLSWSPESTEELVSQFEEKFRGLQ